MSKFKIWVIVIAITLFIGYGFIYHTYMMFLLMFIVGGLGYLAFKGVLNIKDLIDKL